VDVEKSVLKKITVINLEEYQVRKIVKINIMEEKEKLLKR